MLASTVDLSEAAHLQDLLLEYDADPERFDGMERRESPVHDDNPFYLRDYNKCINCWRCVQSAPRTRNIRSRSISTAAASIRSSARSWVMA